MAEELIVNEIFYSLQGESSLVGYPTVFVRLTGCPLRCHYCDTTYAFHEGSPVTVAAILTTIAHYRTPYILLTGGEPLAQKKTIPFLKTLCDLGYQVSLETSGAFDIKPVDTRVKKILDIKTPGSGEAMRNRWENLHDLTAHDEVKLVLTDRVDYEWAKNILANHRFPCPVLFSPAFETLLPATLAQWILEDQLLVRFQLQLHKILWGETRGR
jgi:7-carboxy-7-deazaguanine synthase